VSRTKTALVAVLALAAHIGGNVQAQYVNGEEIPLRPEPPAAGKIVQQPAENTVTAANHKKAAEEKRAADLKKQEIKKQAEERNAAESAAARQLFVEQLDVSEEIADALVSEGFESVEEVAYVPASEWLEWEGLDAERAESLRAKAREVVLKAAEEAEAKLNEIDEDLRTLDGVDEDMLRDLAEANITSRDDLAELSIAELIEITGVSHEEAEKAILAARAHWFAEEDNA